MCIRYWAASTCTVYSSIVSVMCLYMYVQHQQQVATAVERAKQVTMTELNAIIGVSSLSIYTYILTDKL